MKTSLFGIIFYWYAVGGLLYFTLQPVGFVTFSSRTDAEAAMEDLQVGYYTSYASGNNDRLRYAIYHSV